jgi:hypothetical protein
MSRARRTTVMDHRVWRAHEVAKANAQRGLVGRCLGLLAAGLLGACSAADGAGVDEAPLASSTWITAAAGGDLSLDDGAVLRVPPHALAEDGEVTFTRHTCGGVFASDEFTSCLFEVSSTTTIAQPFEIGLPQRKGGEAASSCTAREAALGWPCLAEGGTGWPSPLARARAFSRFASRAVVVPVDDDRVVDAAFEPCGGVLDGRWDLVRTTGTVAQLDRVVWISRAHDPRADCGVGEHFEDQPFTVSGGIMFSPASQSSEGGLGGAQLYEGVEVRRHTLTTLDCLESVGQSCSNADFGNAREGRCDSHDGLCECDVRSHGGVGGYNMPWSYARPGFVHLGDDPLRYCVDGDELRLERTVYDSQTTYVNIYQRVAP